MRERVCEIAPVAHQAGGLDELTQEIHRGNAIARSKSTQGGSATAASVHAKKGHLRRRSSGTVPRLRRCRENWGRPAMPSAAYFRRQADICLRLSLISSDEQVSNRLIIMAREYTAKADALKEAGADAPAAARTPLPDIGRDQAGLSLAANVPHTDC